MLLLICHMACVPIRREIYLQQEADVQKKEIEDDQVMGTYTSEYDEYRLRPSDVVSIKVSSATPHEFNFLTYEGEVAVSSITSRDPLLAGYQIEADGTLTLPVIGSVEVAGLTLAEARTKIQSVITDYLESPTVVIKLLSFQYTMLGEVQQEGWFTTYNTRHTILDAIGNAGGLSDYANGSRVKVVRHHDDRLEVAYVNVLEEDLLASPYYYVRPNDVISVPPLKAKNWRINNAANIGLILSGITATGIFLNWLFR